MTDNRDTIITENEENNDKKRTTSKIKLTKVFKKTLAGVLAVGTVFLVCASCKKNKDEKNENNNNTINGEQSEDIKVIDNLNKVTEAVVDEDEKVELKEETSNDSTKLEETTTDMTEKVESVEEELIVERTVVTQEEVEDIVKNYYSYLDTRIEDENNKVNVGELYSATWMANCQYIDAEETQSMIDAGLIPSDLTTLKAETDNIMSLIISENASKVAVAEAFNTKLDLNKLIEIDALFVNETDKEVAKHSYNEYIELITKTNGDHSLINEKYINSRNFFNNCTKYDFNDLGDDAIYFNHNYPVNFTQLSVGAQYLVKGIMAPEFIIYSASTGAVKQDEAIRFQETINNVEGPISYINDKFNGICFDNEQIKTYVK